MALEHQGNFRLEESQCWANIKKKNSNQGDLDNYKQISLTSIQGNKEEVIKDSIYKELRLGM